MKIRIALALILVAGTPAFAQTTVAQTGIAQTGLPDPFGPPQRQWAWLPDGKAWGTTAGIEIGPHGEIWAIDRCGDGTCDGSTMAAVHQIDPRTGRPIRSIGQGLFAMPHGLHVDKDGNVWVTDAAVAKHGGPKGEQVIKMNPDGKVLMRLGTAGVSGGAPQSRFRDQRFQDRRQYGAVDGGAKTAMQSVSPQHVIAPGSVRSKRFGSFDFQRVEHGGKV